MRCADAGRREKLSWQLWRGKFTQLTGELRGADRQPLSRPRDAPSTPTNSQLHMQAMGILTCLLLDHGRTVVDLTQACEKLSEMSGKTYCSALWHLACLPSSLSPTPPQPVRARAQARTSRVSCTRPSVRFWKLDAHLSPTCPHERRLRRERGEGERGDARIKKNSNATPRENRRRLDVHEWLRNLR